MNKNNDWVHKVAVNLLFTNASNCKYVSFSNRTLDIMMLIELETAVKMKHFSFEGWGKIFHCTTVNI